MNFDYKITIWARVYVHDDVIAENILSDIQSGKLKGTSSDVFSSADEQGTHVEWLILTDTTENELYMEVMNNDGETIFSKQL